jgi:hypothetical protein
VGPLKLSPVRRKEGKKGRIGGTEEREKERKN